MESMERGISEVSEGKAQQEAQIQTDECRARTCGPYPGC